MIEIRFNPKGNILRIDGHADFNPGNDIVCSAVSVLCYTLAQNYQNYYDRGTLVKKPYFKFESGKAVVSATPKKEFEDVFAVMVNAVLTGFLLLQNQYPENVKLVNASAKAEKE